MGTRLWVVFFFVWGIFTKNIPEFWFCDYFPLWYHKKKVSGGNAYGSKGKLVRQDQPEAYQEAGDHRCGSRPQEGRSGTEKCHLR